MSTEEPIVEPPAAAAEPEAQGDGAEASEPAAPAPRKLPPGVRIPRPVRPVDDEIKAQVDALQQSIIKHKRRIEEIKELIDGKRTGRTKGSSEQQAVKNKLAELRGQFQALVSQKTQLRAQLDVAAKARESARTSMKELRGSLKFTKVEDIDQHIAELEHRISHDSLSLNEEKRVMEQVRALKKSRGAIGELTSKAGQLEADNSSVDGLRDGIKGIDVAIDKVKEQEEKLRQQLADMRAKEAETGSDIPGLIQERDECREVCKAAYQKIQDLRADLDAQWAAYKENNALFRVQLAEDRAKRQEEYLKLKAERDAERAARFADQAAEPFDKEVTLCDQLASYLRKFQVAEAAAAQEEARDLSGALEGFKPIPKKEIDSEDTWLLGGKKGGKAKGKAKKEEKKADKAPEKLSHSLDILEAFATLRLEVPLTAEAAGALVGTVAEKKEYFLQRRKEVKESPEPAEPAAAAANGEATEGEEAAAEEGAAEGVSKAKPAKKASKTAAPPQLDDTASWPSIGGAAGPSAAEIAKAEAEAAAEAEAEAEAARVEAEAEAEAARAEAEAAQAEAEAAAEAAAAKAAAEAAQAEAEAEAAKAAAEAAQAEADAAQAKAEAAAEAEAEAEAAKAAAEAAAEAEAEAAAKAAAVAAAAEVEEGELVEEAAEAAAPEAASAASNGEVSAKLAVGADGRVSLTLAP